MGCGGSKSKAKDVIDTQAPGVKDVPVPPTTPGFIPFESMRGGLRFHMVKSHRDGHVEDDYEIVNSTLGLASCGVTVRPARRKKGGEMFACKTFNLTSFVSREEKSRVLTNLTNEIDILCRMDHPNVVRAYEIYTETDYLHLIMELCEGGDLSARTYTEEDACNIMVKLLRAIAYCHSQHNVCHRDLKMENILWEEKGKGSEGEPKLIDFGISRRFMSGESMRERVGTVYTMAPEVLSGSAKEKSDLWSLGCITYHLITGSPAFEAESDAETIQRLRAAKYSWPPGKKVSREAKEFVYNLLKVDPEKRWSVKEALASTWIRSNIQARKSAEVPSDVLQKTLHSMREYCKLTPLKKTALIALAYSLDPQVLSTIRSGFEEFDSDENGIINQQELERALGKMGVSSAEVHEIFKALDVNSAGKIHYLEYLAAALGAVDRVLIDDAHLKDVFNLMDPKGTGSISRAGLTELLGEEYTPDRVEAMLTEMSEKTPTLAVNGDTNADTDFGRLDTQREEGIGFTSFKRIMSAKSLEFVTMGKEEMQRVTAMEPTPELSPLLDGGLMSVLESSIPAIVRAAERRSESIQELEADTPRSQKAASFAERAGELPERVVEHPERAYMNGDGHAVEGLNDLDSLHLQVKLPKVESTGEIEETESDIEGNTII